MQISSIRPITGFIRQIDSLQHFRNKRKRHFEELTEREIEILTLIAGGMNNPAIAEELGISRTTVQNHRSQIRCKLNIRNQIEFIIYALAYDLISF